MSKSIGTLKVKPMQAKYLTDQKAGIEPFIKITLNSIV